MVTKGVASVRSPVCNLQQHNTKIGHEHFTNAVVQSFKDKYAISSEVHFVTETQSVLGEPDIQKGMEELQTVNFRSKHGIVLDCQAAVRGHGGRGHVSIDKSVTRLASSLIGQRYAFFNFEEGSQLSGSDSAIKEVRMWLMKETN